MPIRTDRGRAAVYRKVWGWPLRSPQRLALTTLLAVGAGIGIALLASLGTPGSHLAPEPAGSAVPPITGRHTTPVRPPSSAPAHPDSAAVTSTTIMTTPTADAEAASPHVVQTARVFAASWVTHPPGMTGPQWAAQLAPLVVPEYRAALESVEPSSIPATAVTGDPVVTSTSPAVVEATVPTNAGGLDLVLLAQPDGTWRVRSYDRAAS